MKRQGVDRAGPASDGSDASDWPSPALTPRPGAEYGKLTRQFAAQRYRQQVPASPHACIDCAVSPLRLMHYRGNWHLDEWCHLRKELRNFTVDAIQEAAQLKTPAKEVSDAILDATFGPSYGIFFGMRIRWARLRFTPERAHWIANEQWHSRQHGRRDEQGDWLFDMPYTDPRELMKDILQHMPDVEVLGPPGLRQEVQQRLEQGLQRLGVAG